MRYLLLSLIPLPLLAAPRSYQQARQIAEQHAAKQGITMDHKAVAHVRSMRSSQSTTEAAYYVFPNGHDKGFTIVSGDDRIPAIVGYSDKGTYSDDTLPDGFISFMQAYQDMVEATARGDKQTQQNLAEVETYRATNTTSKAVAPLLGDIQWAQFAPFNNMCPLYDGKNRAATGCVATALAQVMTHYKHPKQLLADIPEYTKTWEGNTVTVPAISTTDGIYSWDDMLPQYANTTYTQSQADAVAKLMYHCGAALKMGYGSVSGSFASPATLSTYFGYDADLLQKVFRYSFTLSEWIQLIDNELAAGRPIVYSGTSSSEGGHEFVCDGSDGNGLYHINWGWNGQQNGYFDLTILNPYKEGTLSSNADDGYNIGCGMLIGIAPDNGKIDSRLADPPAIVMTYYQSSSTIDISKPTRYGLSDTFSLRISNNITNHSQQSLSGRLKFGIRNSDGTYTPIGSGYSPFNLYGMEPDGSFYVNSASLLVDYAFPIGKTTIYALYSTDNGYTWRPCAYKGMRPYVVEATETTLSLVPTMLTTNVTTDEGLTSGVSATFNVSVTNGGDDEFIGSLNVFTNAASTRPAEPTTSIYVSVPAHQTIIRKVELTPSGKQFYLWVTDDRNVTLTNAQSFTLGTSTEPVLSIVRACSNATPDAYETDNAYYLNDKVKAPRVDDDKAVFTYDILNEGAATRLMCGIGINDTYPSNMSVITIPGDGQVTTVTQSFTPADAYGKRTVIAELWSYDETGFTAVPIPTNLPNYKLEAIDGGSYTMSAVKLIAYIAGAPVSQTLTLPATANGKWYATYSNLDKAVQITSPSHADLNVYTINVDNGITLRRTARPDGKVAKGEGVLIESSAPTVTVTALTTDVEPALSNNLTPSGNITWEDGYKYYRLTYSDYSTNSGLGFYWGADNGGPFTFPVASGIAVLKVPALQASSRAFVIDPSAPSHIVPIFPATTDAATCTPIYTVNGQRITTSTGVGTHSLPKGIYIHNHKKHVISR